MSEELKACKYCDNAGWYPDYDPHTGEPEAVQCEFCYTEPDSVFNKFNQLTSERDALRAENERMRKALEFYADDANWFYEGVTDEWFWSNPKGWTNGGYKPAREALKGGDK